MIPLLDPLLLWVVLDRDSFLQHNNFLRLKLCSAVEDYWQYYLSSSILGEKAIPPLRLHFARLSSYVSFTAPAYSLHISATWNTPGCPICPQLLSWKAQVPSSSYVTPQTPGTLRHSTSNKCSWLQVVSWSEPLDFFCVCITPLPHHFFWVTKVYMLLQGTLSFLIWFQ